MVLGIANKTEQALQGIVDSINKVTDLVSEIASASNEQTLSIDQINQSLTQIDQVTQANTSSAEESASAAEELSSQGIHLKQMISRFKLRGFNTAGNFQNTPFKYLPSGQKGNGSGNGHPGHSAKEKEVEPSEVIRLDDEDFAGF